MTQEEALSRIGESTFTFYNPPTMNVRVMMRYPEFNAYHWAVIGWLYSFTRLERIAFRMEGDIKQYWVNYNLALSRLWVYGVRSTYKLREYIEDMCEKDDGSGRPFLLNKTSLKGTDVRNSKVYIGFTDEAIQGLFNQDYIGVQQNTFEDTPTPAPVVEDTPYEFSPEFLKLVEAMKDNPRFEGVSVNLKRGVGYTKDALNGDAYVRALLDGTFLTKFGKDFKTPVKQELLTGITIDDIIRCINEYDYKGDKLGYSTAILRWQKDYSPVVNQFIKETKPTKPKEKPTITSLVERFGRQAILVFGGVDDEGHTYRGYNDIRHTSNTPFFTDLEENDGRIIAMMGKFEEYVVDYKTQLRRMNDKPISLNGIVSLWMQYIANCKDWKERAERDVEYLDAGNSGNSNWRDFCIWIFFREGVRLSTNRSLNEWLDEQKRVAGQMSVQGIASLCFSARECTFRD